MSGEDRAELLAAVWRSLNEITDPCSVAARAPAGLVDMGLIRRVELVPVAEGLRADVLVAVTHPFCMMSGVFLNEVQSRLRLLDGIVEVDAQLDVETMWTPTMMTPEYRQRLGMAEPAAR